MKTQIIVALSCASQLGLAAAADSPADTANLLPGSVFESDQFGRLVGNWVPMQHSSNTSYEFRVEDGVLSILRTGEEPWGQVFLRFEPDALLGSMAEFSVEVAGEFTDAYGEPFEATGIAVVVEASSADLRQRMMGVRSQFEYENDWDAGVGKHDWTMLDLGFEVPENASSIQLYIKMTMGGVLHVRNPRLVEIGNSPSG